jgi:hypothetical protein
VGREGCSAGQMATVIEIALDLFSTSGAARKVRPYPCRHPPALANLARDCVC